MIDSHHIEVDSSAAIVDNISAKYKETQKTLYIDFET